MNNSKKRKIKYEAKQSDDPREKFFSMKLSEGGFEYIRENGKAIFEHKRKTMKL